MASLKLIAQLIEPEAKAELEVSLQSINFSIETRSENRSHDYDEEPFNKKIRTSKNYFDRLQRSSM